MRNFNHRYKDIKIDHQNRTLPPMPHGAALCLVIPYYEAGHSLAKSLESVRLEATDLIIVVDDGSERLPARNFCPVSVGVTPIHLVQMPVNKGITVALREGIDRIPPGYELIGRLDCGDYSTVNRFSFQRAYLQSNPGCAIVGSWVEFVTPTAQSLYLERFPEYPKDVRRRMRINSALCHPAVVFRRSAYEALNGYSSRYEAAEDYALFRAMAETYEAANIPEALTVCSAADGGISELKRRRQIQTRMMIMAEFWDWHPQSVIGMTRSALLWLTPRSFTTKLKRLKIAREAPGERASQAWRKSPTEEHNG